MSETEGLLTAIRNTKPLDVAGKVAQHPFGFAVGVGAANGLIAVLRGKSINVPTAVALTAILGLGEAAINHFEEGPKHYSDWEVGWMSVLGVALGVVPFMLFGRGEESGKSLPIASKETEDAEAAA